MDTKTTEALKKQRYLAAQALQRGNDLMERSPLRNSMPSRNNFSPKTPPTQDHREDYSYESQGGESLIQPHRFRSINITELEEEHTIHLQATPQKVSFEPTEMAARSTLEQNHRRLTIDNLAPDIQQLLHQSISSEVRDLSRRTSAVNDSALHLLRHDDRPDLSLPRTADMSRMSSERESLNSLPHREQPAKSQRDFWDVTAARASFDNSSSNWMAKEMSQLEEMEFRPADEQQSRLLEDEMAWEQENAIIPTTIPTKVAAADKQRRLPKHRGNHVDFSCFSGYLADDGGAVRNQMQATRIEDSSYCSVGEYFNKMSDDLRGMIPDDESPPRRTPQPLVDLSNVESPAPMGERSGFRQQTKNRHGEDKENSQFSISTLVKAINAMGVDESPASVLNKYKQVRGHHRGSYHAPEMAPAQPVHKTSSLKTDLAAVQKSPSFTRELTEAAASRPAINDQLADTVVSFTESLPETSALAASSPLVVPLSANKVYSSIYDGTYRSSSTAKKPLLDTYRVSTATKMSEQQLELPPHPMIREPPKCQKQIFTAPDPVPVKPNRKRRSSSATRQELLDAQEKHLQVVNDVQKRSRSPSNDAELKAVASQLYQDTPKSALPAVQRPTQQKFINPNTAFLKPQPRERSPFTSPKHHSSENRSPFSSPRSVASSSVESSDYRRGEFAETPVSPVSGKSNLLASAVGRSASQCSVASSEYSHRDGVLPLKATHTEMSWGSIKLRMNDKKTMQIKNTSTKKLIIKACITGPGFQLGGNEQSELLTLQGQECRTIVVNFCPTVIGPAVGMLCFQPPHDCYAQRVVSLYGYGGEASIKVEGIQKGPTGPYLELGQARQLARPLEKSFSLYNKGSLPAFARIGIDKKGMDQTFLAAAVYVQPQKVIIPPNSYAHVKVIFKPRRQDVSKILQKQVDVLSITNLHVLWGDEPTRHRIRKIITLIKSNELQDHKVNPLESVCESFPGEHPFIELESFTENLFETIHELFLSFREYELVLTVDRALDDTMVDLSLSEDSSALFKTMCASSDAGSPRLPEEISPAVQQQSVKRESGESWSIRPTSLEFWPHERTRQFVIKSNFYSSQFFELNSNYRPLFKFSPMEGQIRPGQEVIVNVHFQPGQPPREPVVIVVYIENEKITIPVHIRSKSRPGVGHY